MGKIYGIGVMSGTSLDGLDLALCSFERIEAGWKYSIVNSLTIDYDWFWKEKLRNAVNFSGIDLIKLDNEFGIFIGLQASIFISQCKINCDFIASHGHTIFHQPDIQLTYQIGNGAQIAALTGLTTINNFRVMDVALKGQGAPLVPIGDKLLFGEYESCLNLGGIANISMEIDQQRIAFDICPVNIVINKLASVLGFEYDKDGISASQGHLQKELLQKLNDLDFYEKSFPKSLGKEWIDMQIFPILNEFDCTIEDKLRTFYEHISIQITQILNCYMIQNVLVTGGGAYNKFLIELIANKTSCRIEIPDNQTIEFKEALIFAFLGLLRLNNDINCLSSVTGARYNNVGGTIFNPLRKL